MPKPSRYSLKYRQRAVAAYKQIIKEGAGTWEIKELANSFGIASETMQVWFKQLEANR